MHVLPCVSTDDYSFAKINCSNVLVGRLRCTGEFCWSILLDCVGDRPVCPHTRPSVVTCVRSPAKYCMLLQNIKEYVRRSDEFAYLDIRSGVVYRTT